LTRIAITALSRRRCFTEVVDCWCSRYVSTRVGNQ